MKKKIQKKKQKDIPRKELTPDAGYLARHKILTILSVSFVIFIIKSIFDLFYASQDLILVWLPSFQKPLVESQMYSFLPLLLLIIIMDIIGAIGFMLCGKVIKSRLLIISSVLLILLYIGRLGFYASVSRWNILWGIFYFLSIVIFAIACFKLKQYVGYWATATGVLLLSRLASLFLNPKGMLTPVIISSVQILLILFLVILYWKLYERISHTTSAKNQS